VSPTWIASLTSSLRRIRASLVVVPYFNNIAGKAFTYRAILDPVILGSLIILGLGIGFAAGAYPALLLSGVKLVRILKSGFSFTSG